MASKQSKRPLVIDIPAVAKVQKQIISVECAGLALNRVLHEARDLSHRIGMPSAFEFRAAKTPPKGRKTTKKKTKTPEPPASSLWADLLVEFVHWYGVFIHECEELRRMLVEVDLTLDSEEVPTTQRLATQIELRVREAMSHVHPSMYGSDGLGFFRASEVGVPPRFMAALESIATGRHLLECARQQPRERKPVGWTAKELKQIGGIGDTTFCEMCKDAEVKRGGSGSHDHRFTGRDVKVLIRVGRASKSLKRRDAADSWAQELGLGGGG